jgi:hypothetical protein
MKKTLFMLFLCLVFSNQTLAAPIVDITIPNYITTWMDSRHYDPSEIDSLALPPNTNGEKTYYIDGTNGSDSYSGLCATKEAAPSNCGPYKTITAAMGRYDYHRYGERILIRTGTYTNITGWANLTGTNDANHVNTIGPYGDGEVVIDLSQTKNLNSFSNFTGNVWKATYKTSWPGYPSSLTYWAVMDWTYNSCRQAIGYQGTDNRGTNNRTTSFTDTSKNFSSKSLTAYPYETFATDFTGALVINRTDGSYGIVTSVSTTTNPNDTLNFSGGLTGGTENDFDNGDLYAVYLMDADGKWANIDGAFYIVSTSGDPKTRNLLVNPYSQDDTEFFSSQSRIIVYGLTFVGGRSYAMRLISTSEATIEKCRFLFLGKSVFGETSSTTRFLKNFIYAPVMLGWPRGNTWGGGGGWPNGVGNSPWDGSTNTSISDGNIVWQSGGEGTNIWPIIRNNIIVDSFSMNYYLDGAQHTNIYNNVSITSAYREADILTEFYLGDSYFGWRRTYNKVHPSGFTFATENGTGYDNHYNNLYNNISVGDWNNLFNYFEISGSGFKNDKIYNNTFIMSPVIDTYSWMNFGSTGAYLRAASGSDTGSTFYNNLIIGNSANTSGQPMLMGSSTYNLWEVNNNLYYAPDNTIKFLANGTSKDFTNWKSTTGYDSAGIYTETAPLAGINWTDIANITKSDVKLASDSLAINAGVNWDAFYTTDYDYGTRPTGINWDIGAFEYGTTPAIPTCYSDGDGCSVNADCCGGYCCGTICSSSVCTFPTPTPTPAPTAGPTPTPGGPTATPTPTPTVAPPGAARGIAYGKSVTVSSSYHPDTMPASNVTDGYYTTSWQPDPDVPQWMCIDLGAEYNISEVDIYSALYDPGIYSTKYKIQVADDSCTSSSWSTIYETNLGTGGTEELTGLSGSGQYIRLYMTENANWYGINLNEMIVVGTLTSEPTPTPEPTATPTPTPTPTNTPTPTPTPVYSTINIALNKSVSAESEESSGLGPENAVDGDADTRWSSGDPWPDTAWICVDLGETCDINHVKLFWEAAYASGYTIYTSTTSCTEGLTSIYTTTEGNGGTDDLTGLTGNGRYLVIDSTTKGSVYGYSLYEVEAYSNSACLVVTPTPTATPSPTPTTSAGSQIKALGGGIRIKNITSSPPDSQMIKNLR